MDTLILVIDKSLAYLTKPRLRPECMIESPDKFEREAELREQRELVKIVTPSESDSSY